MRRSTRDEACSASWVVSTSGWAYCGRWHAGAELDQGDIDAMYAY